MNIAYRGERHETTTVGGRQMVGDRRRREKSWARLVEANIAPRCNLDEPNEGITNNRKLIAFGISYDVDFSGEVISKQKTWGKLGVA